ncbi:hypothetical protein BD289DRAFT_229146 [Coniella lustricola]|uniref:Uncharacterized protein n=1 Tax=Coniella lustricola TaxID=2025994 RepID=A0A2T3AAI0_9PEZI|nr:hypothetical protein BD289DRAFT_229146 [Coniella lustricola]
MSTSSLSPLILSFCLSLSTQLPFPPLDSFLFFFFSFSSLASASLPSTTTATRHRRLSGIFFLFPFLSFSISHSSRCLILFVSHIHPVCATFPLCCPTPALSIHSSLKTVDYGLSNALSAAMPRKQAARPPAAAVPDEISQPAQQQHSDDADDSHAQEAHTTPAGGNIGRILGDDPEFADTFFGAVSSGSRINLAE